MKENLEKTIRLMIGVIAMLIYAYLYTLYGAYYFFFNRLIATLASTFFIQPIIKAVIMEINIKKLFENLLYGFIFLFIYIFYSHLTTFDMVRIFLEQFIAVAIVLYIVSHVKSILANE